MSRGSTAQQVLLLLLLPLAAWHPAVAVGVGPQGAGEGHRQEAAVLARLLEYWDSSAGVVGAAEMLTPPVAADPQSLHCSTGLQQQQQRRLCSCD